MHAVILAGGKGVRLRPYTTVIPKPLVPIGDEHSILEIILMQLAHEGFASVTLAIGHFGHLIRSFVGDGSRWGLTVDYVEEDAPLGTIGPLLPILDSLPEHFVVMNGDVLTDLPFADLLEGHIASGDPLTVATFDRRVHVDFGVLDVTDGHISAFREKPTLPFSVSMGVYGLSRETLRVYQAGQPFGFDELVLDLLDRRTPPRIFAFDGYWLDIGRPEDYDRANEDFEVLRSAFLPVELPTQRRASAAESPLATDDAAAHAVPSTTPATRTGRSPGRSRSVGSRGDAPRLLVLGGSGFIGGHVLAELSSRPDVELLCVARSSDAIPAFPTVALDIAHGGGLQLERLLRRFAPTVVVNCAGAIAGDLEAMAAANIGLVGTLVDSIASSGVDARIVHIGSSAEYGPGTPGTPVSEKDVPRPTSPYAVTKLAGTKTVLRASGSQQPGAVVLRVFNPVGPGSSSASLTGRVLAELDRVRHEGGPLRLGPLGAARDFVDVRDVATATARAALLPGDLNGIVNVGGGRAVPVRRFVQALCREAQFDGEIVEDRPPSDRSAHVDWQCADITRAGTMLGWHPAFDLADSVRDILASRVPS